VSSYRLCCCRSYSLLLQCDLCATKNIACLRPVGGTGLVCQACTHHKKKCSFPKVGTPIKSVKSVIVEKPIASGTSKTVSGGKRKARETSPEPVVSSSLLPSPLPLSFDSRPLKKPSSSSLQVSSDSPACPSPISPPPSSFSSSISADNNPALRLELNRVSQQLNASREDLIRERQGRYQDRLLFEQELAWFKSENERLIAEKEKGRD
jgi:hypothetical protein